MIFGERLDPLLLAGGLLVLWAAVSALVGETALPAPWTTLQTVASLLASVDFWGNAAATGERFGAAVVISVVLGLIIGYSLGFSRFAAEVAAPVLSSLYAIPKITLYPVILLIFGLGAPAIIAFGVIHGVFPVIIFSMDGFLGVKRVIRKTARVMRLTRTQTIFTILLPAALPETFSGIRVGVALALLGTLIGELFASTQGIGFLLLQAANRDDLPDTLALVLLLFVVAVAAGGGLLGVDRRLRHDR